MDYLQYIKQLYIKTCHSFEEMAELGLRCSFLYLLFYSFSLHAQTPQAFNYQAVCRDTMGTPLSNQVVRYRTSILQSSPSGTIIYQETHTDTTNIYGISTLQIGRGTTIQGTFASIPWVSGSYYLSIEIDPAGGNNYRRLGTPELLSVPYALFSSDGLPNGTQPNQLVYWNGTAWDTLNPGNPGQMLTLCNGNLIWGTCPGNITSLDCNNAQHSGTLIEGVAAVQISSTIAYTGGNGGIHAGQTIASTGVSGLIATCTSGYFGNGSGTVTYSISGTPVGSGTASFAISIGGQNCTLTRLVNVVAAITNLDCGNSLHLGTLVNGVVASSVSSRIPYTGGNGGGYTAQSVSSSGVTGLTGSITSGVLTNGNDSVTLSITGTPSHSGTASFTITIGGQNCTLTRVVDPGLITGLSCSTAVNSGTLVQGLVASGASSLISYTGGNAGSYYAQTISSTGVTGLTATLSAGNFVSGNGTISYIISGTPIGNGTASFAITIGGQICTLTRTVLLLWRSGMVHCGSPTQVIPVTNPTTGKTWMDRNLGATQAATSSTDANAYGDLYQWGRFGDGHQCRNSTSTASLSNTDTPGHGYFITTSNDWRSPQNNSLWQGVNGFNNPCPYGYRLPTGAELDAERLSWTNNASAGAFASPLKLVLGGSRHIYGYFANVNSHGNYWSSDFTTAHSRVLNFQNGNAVLYAEVRGLALSIRCIRE